MFLILAYLLQVINSSQRHNYSQIFCESLLIFNIPLYFEDAMYEVSMWKTCLTIGYCTLHPVSSIASLCVKEQREMHLRELNVR